MKSSPRISTLATAFLAATLASPGRATPPQTFAPLDQWKAAVIAGDKAALARFYSTDPPAAAQVGKTKVANLDDELGFWAGLKTSGITRFNPKVLEIAQHDAQTRVLLRIEAVKPDHSQPGGIQAVVASMAQIWTQQADGWRILATGRSDFSPAAARRLPQPAIPNTSLYPDPGEAQAELKAASATAAQENKRVLVVFGANWCYDCHVLDTTFHSEEFAPLVNANYVVVHINIGEEGKDNNDLAARLGAALDKGIPSLAVLNPDGSVVVAQKGGEFESTVKISPEDVRAFLEKWKPTPPGLLVPLAAQLPIFTPPVLPAAAKALEVAPGPGVKLKFHYLAVGKQFYNCENGAWAKSSTPDAALYDTNANLKVHHSAGPSWTMVDGAGAIKAIGPTAIHFAAPDGISIDWLKLDVDPASRTGAFSDVAIIQRLYTGGGRAPSTACNAAEVWVSPYTAHYYFWIVPPQ